MDKLINDRKKQLHDMKHMLKMQDLLEEYDRQNQYLNRQVQNLLIQNVRLKQQNSFISTNGSRIMTTDQFYSKGSRKNLIINDENKNNIYNKSRKSRYQYMFDENQIKDLKNNIKNQIKRDAFKNISTKEVQTNLQQINMINLPSSATKSLINSKSQLRPNTTKINQLLYTKSQTKNDKIQQQYKQNQGLLFTPIKQQTNYFIQTKTFEIQNSMNHSKSKSKEKARSKQKLQVISKSKIIKVQQQPKLVEQKQYQFSRQLKQQKKEPLMKQQTPHILQHSFGHTSQIKLQKKFTLMENDLSGVRDNQKNNQSRITNKFIPLSIQSKQFSKQISTNMPKSQFRSQFKQATQNQSIIRTSSKPKKNHSLNPSPKVQYKPYPSNQPLSQTVKQFILKTQQIVQASSIQLSRNPSQKIKRKFIKIISNPKFPPNDSPKKR